VCTHLRLNSAQEYLDGNNSLVIPTDTIKNIVLVLAKKNGVFLTSLAVSYDFIWKCLLYFFFQNASKESLPPSACQMSTKVTFSELGIFSPLVLILQTPR